MHRGNVRKANPAAKTRYMAKRMTIRITSEAFLLLPQFQYLDRLVVTCVREEKILCPQSRLVHFTEANRSPLLGGYRVNRCAPLQGSRRLMAHMPAIVAGLLTEQKHPLTPVMDLKRRIP